MQESSLSIGAYGADVEGGTDAPFSVQSILEVDGRLVIRVAGTALGVVESRACREIVERIARLRGWDPNGAQTERAFGGAGQFTRDFVFADEA